MKKCNRCKKVKEYTEFNVDSRASTGRQSICRKCGSEKKKEMKGYYREQHLKSKYGITSKDYEDMLEAQDCKCAICGIEEKYCENQRLAVDHDYESGKVRALLCKKCNQGIGLLQDSSEFAYNAYQYLQRFGK